MDTNNILKRTLNSAYAWSLLAMTIIVVVLCAALWTWMNYYTHHGEGVDVPNVKGMMLSDASYALGKVDLITVVTDSSYNRDLPAGTVLEQTPGVGSRVKAGREIYLTVNAQQIPTLPIPDIADNCSLREAEAKLRALGFKLGNVEHVPGDKDWVLGVKCRGKNVYFGDRVPIDAPIVLVVGNNEMEMGESIGGEESWSDGENDGDVDMIGTDEEIEIEL